MAITQTITTIPKAGHRGVDARETFVTKQEAFQDALVDTFVTEINTFRTQANTLETNVNAKEASATNQANIATTKAEEASMSATIALNASNYKGDWVSGYQTTGYSQGMSVSYADGFKYVSKINNNLTEPITKTNAPQWDYLEAVSPAELDLKADKLNPTITGLKETSVAMGANDINLATGNLFTKTITGATTLTVSSVPASGTVAYIILELTNAGSSAITWFGGVKWAGGTAPTLTSAGKDILSFYTHDGGITWNVIGIQKDVK